MPHRIAHVVLSRLNGKRGRFLVAHTVIFSAIGYSYLVAVPTTSRLTALSWMPEWMPMQWLCLPWFIAAVIAIVAASTYEPPRTDRYGFAAVTAVPLLWGLLFAVSWVLGLSGTAWISSVTYLGYAAIIMVVSSWPNPIHVELIPTPPDHPEGAE